MYAPAERDALRTTLLERALADKRITATAVTGSAAADAEDEWSDVDLFFGVADGVDREEVIDAWTERIDRDFRVVHHWDLASPTSTYRVFLLSNGLEVDIGFTSQADFAARGARFRPVFGEHETLDAHPPPPANDEACASASTRGSPAARTSSRST